ncbi:MAG: diguanylate cyclase, partial [Halanaerobacter sp.]
LNNVNCAVAVFEAINEGENFRFVDLNKKGQEIEDINKEEIINKKVTEVFTGIKEFGLFEVLKRVYKTGKPEEYPIKRYEDERISGYRKNYVYKLSSGEIVAVYEDITEQKERERKLKKQKDKLELSIKGANLGFWEWDNREKKITFSDKLCKVLGYEFEGLEASIETWKELIHNEDKARVLKKLNQHFEGVTPSFESEYRVETKKGDYKWIKAAGKVIDREKDRTPIKAVGLFQDINNRKRQKEKIRYISYHDQLTDLYNRNYLEKEMERLDTKRQLPISIIMTDVNGLKLINDTFGHQVGDQLLIKVAEILQETCRDEDIIARFGGDEFIIFLPQTTEEEAKEIQERIKRNCQQVSSLDVPLSAALGVATKDKTEQDLWEVRKEADEVMYQNKLKEGKKEKSKIIKALINKLESESLESMAHLMQMQRLIFQFEETINLSTNQLESLLVLATLHDIGKIAVPEEILKKPSSLTEDEWEKVKKHSQVGYHLTSATEQFANIAKAILHHHEHWDGSGYPESLQGEEIPLLSRILAIVDAYDVMIRGRPYKEAMSREESKKELKKEAGEQFDPKLVEKFLQLI